METIRAALPVAGRSHHRARHAARSAVVPRHTTASVARRKQHGSTHSLRLRVTTRAAPEGRVMAADLKAPNETPQMIIEQLTSDLDQLIDSARAGEVEYKDELALVAPELQHSAQNLVHYIMLRRSDLRNVQRKLQLLGLSSLGSCEAHVMPSLLAVRSALQALSGKTSTLTAPELTAFVEGRKLLDRHADQVLGPGPKQYRTRIMVTMPSEASADPVIVEELLDQGMDIMRVNCAHDGPAQWAAMVDNLRAAEKKVGRTSKVSFDLAGPKLRTESVTDGPAILKWTPKKREDGEVLENAKIVMVAPGRDAAKAVELAGEGAVVMPLATGQLAEVAKREDKVIVEDAWGKLRKLTVTNVLRGDAVICETDKKACVLAGARLELKQKGLKLRRADGGAAASPPRDAVGAVPPAPGKITIRSGDRVRFERGCAPGTPGVPETDTPAKLSIDLPAVFQGIRVGHRVFMDDGKFGGTVTHLEGPEGDCAAFEVHVTDVVGGVAKLLGEKGINLPDTVLPMSAIGVDDYAALKAILPLKPDMVALSFVQTPQDILDLHKVLADAGATETGIVLKIETATAFENLPDLLLTAMRRPRCAVMVARGDLGVEVGFARLSEVQEEMLWVCEAAHVPVVWATQVLESFAKNGIPTRAEVTDAAMGGRAEAVMLNKGPFMPKVLAFLKDILWRLSTHEDKKMHLFRKLKVSEGHLASAGAWGGEEWTAAAGGKKANSKQPAAAAPVEAAPAPVQVAAAAVAAAEPADKSRGGATKQQQQPKKGAAPQKQHAGKK